MKKLLFATLITVPMSVLFSGCTSIGDKTASLSVIYAAAAILSLIILVGYCFKFRAQLKNQAWFILLFSSVLTVNIGYFLLSVSRTLSQALWANRISYLGSVVLPLTMLMIILQVTNTLYKKWLPYCLFVLSGAILFVAASPGWLDIYYKEVSLTVQNGVSSLAKVYGPLHIIYLFFLLGYFAAMVAVIIRAMVKKRIESPAHSVLLAIAVFVNIGVWLIEQLADTSFEMLSVSYIISELFLLGVHLLVSENQRLKKLVNDAQSAKPAIDDNQLLRDFEEINTLTATERKIFDAYIKRATTKEIMEQLCITENTLKFHNKNIYSKLGVRSRKELLEIYKQINSK